MFVLQKLEGVAQLLFEMMKGVKDRFHSCSEEVSTVIFGLQSILVFPEMS
jgi:hypothetical protein